MSVKFCSIGVDLGGTKIEIALVDESGKIMEHLRLATDVQGGHEAIEKQIIKGVKQLYESSRASPIGIGVGVAGQVDSSSGLVHFAPNLYWHDVPFCQNLKQVLEIPVVVTNDVRAATWGEWIHGAGKGCDDFVCVFLGTGIGGGIVSAGRMMQGSTNSAGEIGHTTVDLYGPSCTCGNRGCLEAIAGGWAIARSGKEAVISTPLASKEILSLARGDEEAITAKLVIQAAKKGDPLAQGIIEKVFEAIIAGSVSLINAFNPSRLIFGGGLAKGLSGVIKTVEMGVQGKALKSATKSLEILEAKLGDQAPVIGAATFAMHTLKKEKNED